MQLTNMDEGLQSLRPRYRASSPKYNTSLHQRQARVGNAILRLRKYKAVSLRIALNAFFRYSKDKQDELKFVEVPSGTHT
jgi:hypothetical protein